MARQKDELYNEETNSYDRLTTDIDLYKLERRLDMLSCGLYSIEDEQILLNKIDQISEERLAREKHILENMKLVEARSKDYIGVNRDFDPIWLFRIIPIVIVFTLILMTSLFAHAQNLTVWCLVSDFNTQCIYYNLDTCQTEANQFGGVCLPKQIN